MEFEDDGVMRWLPSRYLTQFWLQVIQVSNRASPRCSFAEKKVRHDYREASTAELS